MILESNFVGLVTLYAPGLLLCRAHVSDCSSGDRPGHLGHQLCPGYPPKAAADGVLGPPACHSSAAHSLGVCSKCSAHNPGQVSLQAATSSSGPHMFAQCLLHPAQVNRLLIVLTTTNVSNIDTRSRRKSDINAAASLRLLSKWVLLLVWWSCEVCCACSVIMAEIVAQCQRPVAKDACVW